MNEAKCKALKEELGAQPEPQIVAAERFFDCNDDPGYMVGLILRPGRACAARIATDILL